MVLAGLPASVEVDRARLEFAQLLLENLRRIDQERRDTRSRLAPTVGGVEDPAERRRRPQADHHRLREVSDAGIAGIVGGALGLAFMAVLTSPSWQMPEPTPSSP